MKPRNIEVPEEHQKLLGRIIKQRHSAEEYHALVSALQKRVRDDSCRLLSIYQYPACERTPTKMARVYRENIRGNQWLIAELKKLMHMTWNEEALRMRRAGKRARR